jgi:copper(I)-binding protein
MKAIALATALLAIGAGAAYAQNAKVGNIEVAHPWAPVMTDTVLTNSAAYMTLTNQGTAPDELISASSPIAQKVEPHVFGAENDVYGMHRVSAIQINPGVAATVLWPCVGVKVNSKRWAVCCAIQALVSLEMWAE